MVPSERRTPISRAHDNAARTEPSFAAPHLKKLAAVQAGSEPESGCCPDLTANSTTQRRRLCSDSETVRRTWSTHISRPIRMGAASRTTPKEWTATALCYLVVGQFCGAACLPSLPDCPCNHIRSAHQEQQIVEPDQKDRVSVEGHRRTISAVSTLMGHNWPQQSLRCA